MAHDVVSGVLDPITGAKEAKSAENKNTKNVKKAIEALNLAFGQSLATQQDALGIFREGFSRVLGDINTLGDVSRQGARDQLTQSLGSYRQTGLGRGLSSSTVQQNFERGARRNFVDDLARINEGLATLKSNVRLGGLQMETGLLGGIARSQENRGTAEASFRSGVQYQAPPSILQQLGGAQGIASIAAL